jgi:phenazine biosynthesis protein PhzF family
MRTYTCYQVDAFTETIFSGNPASVILDATNLTDDEMQQIAREFNNSETAFIIPSLNPNYDVHIRFFTPTNEVPICGHATIAAHFIRALTLKLKNQRVYQKTKAGILPVDIILEENSYRIVMTQGNVKFGDILSPSLCSSLQNALGITPTDINCNFPIQIVSTGHSKVMVPINNLNLLHRLQPNLEKLKSISKQIECNGFYIFTLTPNEKVLVHGRMFAPAIGISEDPVTGNANGPLGAYLFRYYKELIKANKLHFFARQGESMGRAGIIEVTISIENEKISQVQVAGKATLVFQTKITLPDSQA